MVRKCQLRGHSGPVLNQVIPLGERDITLGRDLANDIVIADSEVSRTHARLTWQDDGHAIRDLKSTNGTWVNGRPAFTATKLAAGDLLTLGKVSVFVYEPVPESELDTTHDVPGDEERVDSTMAMPAFPEAALEAKRLIRPKSAEPAVQPEQAPSAQLQEHSDTQQLPDTASSGGRSFHERYVAYVQEDNLEGLLSLYHPGATVLSADKAATGSNGIREFFQQYFGGLGHLKAKPTGKYSEGPDSILCETSLETPDRVAVVQDVFVLRDGKATHHFTCTVAVTPRLT